MPSEELTFLLANHMQSYARILLETLIDNRPPLVAQLTSASSQKQAGNLSSLCRNELIRVSSSALKNELWALKVFDSNGRLQSGLISGSLLNSIGNYEQCLSGNNEPIGHLDGGTQYCVAKLDLAQEAARLASITSQPKALFTSAHEGGRLARVGLCSPATCSPAELASIGNQLIESVTSSSVSIQKIECYSQADSIGQTIGNDLVNGNIGLLVGVTILVLVIGACTAATILDSTFGDGGSKRRRTPSRGMRSWQSKALNWMIDSFSLLRGYKNLTAKRGIKNNWAFSSSGVNVEKHVDLRALDGLRAISMLWTITVHSYNFGFLWLMFDNVGQVDNVYKSIWVQWIANGTFSVDNFFLISGLLAYLKHFKSSRQQQPATKRRENFNQDQDEEEEEAAAYLSSQDRMPYSARFKLLATILLRYLRLAPTMMFMILFSVCILPLLAFGPNWSNSTIMFDSWCRSNWHLNLIMAHNLISTPNMCFSHSWYVAADFQLFCLVQLLLFTLDFMANTSTLKMKLIYSKRALVFGAIVAQMIVATIVFSLGLPSAPLIQGDSLDAILGYQSLVYIKPYYWASSHFLGALLAVHIVSMAHNKPSPLAQRSRGRVRNISTNSSDASSSASLGNSGENGWTFALIQLAPLLLMALLLISMLPVFRDARPMSRLLSTSYALLARPLWSISLLCLLLNVIMVDKRTNSKLTGHSKLLLITRSFRSLMKSNVWLPISRLSYCAYLLHPVVMAIFYGSRLETFQFSHSLLLYFTLGNIVITYFGALILFLAVEFPIQTTIKQIAKQSKVFQRSLGAAKRGKLGLQKLQQQQQQQQQQRACIVSTSETTSSLARAEFFSLSSRPR